MKRLELGAGVRRERRVVVLPGASDSSKVSSVDDMARGRHCEGQKLRRGDAVA